MEMSKQNTLKGSFALCGKGLHTGLNLTITFNPANENTGYKIQRIDLEASYNSMRTTKDEHTKEYHPPTLGTAAGDAGHPGPQRHEGAYRGK